MSEGVVAAILRSYRDPRAEIAARKVAGLTEARALGDLALGCVLAFVASMPGAMRQARGLEIEDAVPAAVTAHLFGYLFVAPLLFYGLAALLHLGARAFGGRGSYLSVRTALFWTLVLGGPMALGVALVGVLAEAFGLLALVDGLSLVAFGWWLWLLGAGMAEAEGFGSSRWVAGTLIVGVFGVWAALVLMDRAATAG